MNNAVTALQEKSGQEGILIGEAPGWARGRAGGRIEGKAPGMQAMLIDSIQARFGGITDSLSGLRIRSTSDTGVLLQLSRPAGRIEKTGDPEMPADSLQ